MSEIRVDRLLFAAEIFIPKKNWPLAVSDAVPLGRKSISIVGDMEEVFLVGIGESNADIVPLWRPSQDLLRRRCPYRCRSVHGSTRPHPGAGDARGPIATLTFSRVPEIVVADSWRGRPLLHFCRRHRRRRSVLDPDHRSVPDTGSFPLKGHDLLASKSKDLLRGQDRIVLMG